MKRLVILTLALAMAVSLLAACGSKGEVSTSGPAAQATATPSPTPTPIPYTPDVLTGLEQTPGDPADGQRITAIMVNNISNTGRQNARPQRGLSEAGILIESKVEGSITRFCALYDDVSSIPEVGPLRSGRDQFFQLVMPWNALYYHDGESVFTTEFIRDYDYSDLNIGGKPYFGVETHPQISHRDSRGRDVALEHTEFTSGEEIQQAIDKYEIDMNRDYTSTFFDFVPYYESPRTLEGEVADTVSIRHSSSYRTYFDYDTTSGQYLMSMYSPADGTVSATVDENNNTQLGFTNLVVLFTEIADYPGDSKGIQKVEYAYGGVGYYFCGGQVEYIRWQKGGPLEALRLFTGDGTETSLKINPGKTYLAVVDLDEYDGFHYEGAGQQVEDNDFTANSYVDTEGAD